jgi:hypothetical protein
MVEAEPPPSVWFSSVASVTPAERIAGIVSCAPEPDSGVVSEGDSVGDSAVGSSEVLDEAAGSEAVSSVPSEPQAVSPAARARPARSAAAERLP